MSDNENQESGHGQPPPPAPDQELNQRPPGPLLGGVRLFRGTEISLNGIRHHDEGGVGAEEKLAFIPITLSSDPDAIMMTHMEEMMFLRTGSEAGVSMRSVMNFLIGVPIPIQTQRPKED